jgi:DNA mismatch repair protein MSH6
MNRRSKQPRKARVVRDDDDDDDDAFEVEPEEPEDDDDDMADFIVSDDSDAPSRPKKRKRAASKPVPRKKTNLSPSPGPGPGSPVADDDEEIMQDIPPATSTAQKWKYDPDDVRPRETAAQPAPTTQKPTGPKPKPKPHTKEPEERYPWLANILDANKNPPGHPDYDPTTLYIPPLAERNFSPFEKQYWDIKKNLWDTVVFFKKGKFYELYENDATIGHQLFDLKLTDRVNMRMVGVPESSLDMWVNQFVAKGFKVARVDQMESALGKEMRERETAGKKADKVIRRELACILTAGTLVDGSMLQDDMATYCAAIKETMVDDRPAFGIAFVDAATGQFFLSEWEDDVELTRFETFVAQTSPRELLLEKGRLSTKALRILKNNTGPTTIWNYLKPGTEFWEADTARRELDCSGYFTGDGKEDDAPWPQNLAERRTRTLPCRRSAV